MYSMSSRSDIRLTIFKHHGHRSTLVQNSKLALGCLLVGGVSKDTTVQQCPVGISHHGSDISGTVRLAVTLGVLQRVEVLLGVVLPVSRVTLVTRVDGAALGDLHVGVGEDELAERGVEGEAVDGAALHRDDELGRGTVHGEASGQQLGSGLENVLLGARGALGQLVDAENGADRHTGVQVGAAVDGVAGHGVARVALVLEEDDVLLLFRHYEGALARRPHRLDKDVIANHVQLLLVVTRGIGLAGQTRQVY